MSFAMMMLIGCVIDSLIGWPGTLYARIGHPVMWIGALIDMLETRLNHGSDTRRLWFGTATTACAVAGACFVGALLQSGLPDGWLGLLIGGVLAWPLIAIRSMHDHIAAVETPLSTGDITEARRAVSMIVGRNPETLDENGIARASLESLAENTSDGIVAPVFWGVVAGLPGLAAYKAINTLDSMIGHRSDRYEYFGKVAARLDDLVNIIPARFSGLLFSLVSRHTRRALRVMRRDASSHRSPNAGWPEGAMAGALNVRLSGPRVYDSHIADEPWLNAQAPDPTPEKLREGLELYRWAMAALILGIAILAFLGV